MKDKLIIKNGEYAEPLNSVLPDTFQVQKTVNQSWQLQFTAWDDHSVAFSLLASQNSILWRGQEFIIKQIQPTYANSLNSTQVTATHVGYEVSRLFKHQTNSGTKTYTVNDVLNFYLNGNEFGYTWEVHGSFDKEQIENLGNSNGQDMLSKITSTWNNAIISFDNKKIKVYSTDAFYHDDGQVITYLGNSNQIQLTYDSTSLVNKLYCTSDNGEDGTPAFNPFYVQNNDSIKKYGVYEGNPVSDNRFTNADAMRKYAESQLQPNPSLSIQVQFNANNNDIDIGDVRTLIIPELSLKTQVKVTQITTYPISDTQQSQAQLENTAKTILNYNSSLQGFVQQQSKIQSNVSSSITNAIQSNQDEINRINESLKQSTQTVSTDAGSITFTLNNGVVYVNCDFVSIEKNSTWQIPSGFGSKNAINNSVVISVNNVNYIVNYSITDTTLTITNISDLSGSTVSNLENCTANFNYLI